MMKFRGIAVVLSLCVCGAASARAATSLSVNHSITSSDVSPLTGTITYPGTINDPAGYATVSTVGGYGFNQGTSPFGESNWLSLGDGQDITFTFSQPMDYVGLYWGTPDSYNLLDVYDGSMLIGSYTGGDIGSAGYADIFATGGQDITSITLSSSGFYFESDNLSYQLASTATPEPGSLFLLGTGVIGFAGLVRRKIAARIS